MAPKPLTSAAVVSTTQTQQRLIMPATPLPQIQPNFTNLPSAVLAPAPGGGNVGYAVVPAQYVTQVGGVFIVVFLFCFGSTFPLNYLICMCFIYFPLLTISSSAATTIICDTRQQLQFPSISCCPDTGQVATQWVMRNVKRRSYLVWCLFVYILKDVLFFIFNSYHCLFRVFQDINESSLNWKQCHMLKE